MINKGGRLQQIWRRLQPYIPKRQVIINASTNKESKYTESLNLLQAKGKSSFAVTEFITQYDELRQLEFMDKLRPTTPQMAKGSALHKKYEDQTEMNPLQITFNHELHDNLERNVRHFVDFIDKIIALSSNNMTKYGVVRELPIRGYVPGSECILRGVIDCAFISREGIVIMETKTTKKASPALMKMAYHQALTYYWLLEYLISSQTDPMSNAMFMFGIDESQDQHTIAKEYADAKAGELKKSVVKLSQIGMAPFVNLQFITSTSKQSHEEIFELQYDKAVFEQSIKSRLDLFHGKRDVYGFRLSDVDIPVIITDHIVPLEGLTDSQRAAYLEDILEG